MHICPKRATGGATLTMSSNFLITQTKYPPLNRIFAGEMEQMLVFSTSAELVRIPAPAVVYVIADGNYSDIRTVDGSSHLLTMQLGHIERRMADLLTLGSCRFVRIGKSLIVNLDFVSFIHVARQKIQLSDCRTFCHELSASKEALRLLKELIEKEDRR